MYTYTYSTYVPQKKTVPIGLPLPNFASKEEKYISSDANMKNYFIFAAVISTVIAIPLPDVQSAEQQQWSDGSSPFLLSPIPNGQLIASNPQNGAQTGFEETNAGEPSVPFAMEIQQIAVGGGLPSIQPNEVVNAPTSFVAASTIPSMNSGFPEAISGAPGSDSNEGKEPVGDLVPGPPSSSPPPTTAPGSIPDPKPLDIKPLVDSIGINDERR